MEKSKSPICYQIEYYNKMWKDWLLFDQALYKTEKNAQLQIDTYRETNCKIKTRIIKTNIIAQKVDKRKKRVKITTEHV